MNEKLIYDKARLITINYPSSECYYTFDYDTRSFSVNMEFQHFHEYYEIYIFLDEDAGHIIEGKYYEMQPFDLIALKPNILHKTYYSEGTPKKRLIINFILDENTKNIEEVKELLSIFEVPIPIYRFGEKERKELLAIINEIFRISEKEGPLKNLLIHQRFMDFLCAVYSYKEKNLYKQRAHLSSMTDKIYAITSYIHANYASELSLDTIAKSFYVSSYYLSREFKKVTGFTLINYIQMTRVKNAEQLLMNTELKITEIAQQCGFTSFSQFNRVFNKFCDTSPSQFRNKQANL